MARGQIVCINCGAEVGAGSKACKHCGQNPRKAKITRKKRAGARRKVKRSKANVTEEVTFSLPRDMAIRLVKQLMEQYDV